MSEVDPHAQVLDREPVVHSPGVAETVVERGFGCQLEDVLVAGRAGPTGGIGLLRERAHSESELLVQASLVPPPEQVTRNRAHVGGAAPAGIEIWGVGTRVRAPPQLRAQVDADARPFYDAGREKAARLDPVVAVGEPGAA